MTKSALATTPVQLPVTSAGRRMERLNAPEVQIAYRIAGIGVRKAFTDSLKRFSAYVDEAGNTSRGGKGIYIQLSRRINTTFGLSRESAEKFLAGGSESLRDLCSVVELLTLQMLEIDLTNRVDAGMAARQPRLDIKQSVYDCIDDHGSLFQDRFRRWKERV